MDINDALWAIGIVAVVLVYLEVSGWIAEKIFIRIGFVSAKVLTLGRYPAPGLPEEASRQQDRLLVLLGVFVIVLSVGVPVVLFGVD